MNTSGVSAVGRTITGGIQDIAALLPLLGTEQCENHITSALTKGYLYAAVTPISIFGSLGAARAGFKTFFASFSIPRWNIFGARTLAHMGFEPKGTNLSLIMVDSGNTDQYLMDTQLDNLLKELHIDNLNMVRSVSFRSTQWNIAMILLAAFFSLLSLVPYIYLNVRNNSALSHLTRWIFPVLRAIGGFLTATMIQFVVRTRITTLAERMLARRPDMEQLNGRMNKSAEKLDERQRTSGDIEKGLGSPRNTGPAWSVTTAASEKYRERAKAAKTADNERQLRNSYSKLEDVDPGNSALMWFLLAMLLIGTVASVVGYVGCFSVVQSATSSTGPLTWLCLEAGLSLIRLVIWGSNPMWDDAPPMELVLKLDPRVPFSTCMKYDDELWEEKVLPLTRASQFLESITSFAGLLNRFVNPDVTLYYTLVRKKVEDSETPRPGERVLYITIFDHKEQTTRIYTRDSNEDCFYQTESNSPVIDLNHGLLEVRLAEKIAYRDDMIASNRDFLCQLREHYRSIMDGIHFTIGKRSSNDQDCIIENRWTMKMQETVNTRQRERKSTWMEAVRRGIKIEDNGRDSSFDFKYLKQGLLEKKRRQLLQTRGQWIEDYMKWVVRETKWAWDLQCREVHCRAVQGDTVSAHGRRMLDRVRSDGELEARQPNQQQEPGGVKDVEIVKEVELQLIHEQYQMEMLLLDEVEGWEGELLRETWAVLNEDPDDRKLRKLEKKRFINQWKMTCWRRLTADRRATWVRMEAAKMQFETRIGDEPINKGRQKLEQMWRRRIQTKWDSIMNKYVVGSENSLSSPSSPSLPERVNRIFESIAKKSSSSAPVTVCNFARREMESRLRREQENIQLHLVNGLKEYDMFCSHPSLPEIAHSKWLWLTYGTYGGEPFELASVSHALKKNKNVIFIIFKGYTSAQAACIMQTIGTVDIPSLTSVRFRTRNIPTHLEQLLDTIEHDAEKNNHLVFEQPWWPYSIKKILRKN